MAPEEERPGGPESGEDDFQGRDLLVGRPEGAQGRATTGAAGAAEATTSPQPGAHEDAIREILQTVQATAARIDALQDTPGPAHETAEALARETAALTQAVKDARVALAKAAELAARRDEQASAGARALAEGAAALKAQGETLDKRLRATGRQAEAAAEGMAAMKQAATVLESSLRVHARNMTRFTERQRWRPWLTGLAIGAASFVFFVLGAVLQREANVVSLGDQAETLRGCPCRLRARHRASSRAASRRRAPAPARRGRDLLGAQIGLAGGAGLCAAQDRGKGGAGARRGGARHVGLHRGRAAPDPELRPGDRAEAARAGRRHGGSDLPPPGEPQPGSAAPYPCGDRQHDARPGRGLAQRRVHLGGTLEAADRSLLPQRATDPARRNRLRHGADPGGPHAGVRDRGLPAADAGRVLDPSPGASRLHA